MKITWQENDGTEKTWEGDFVIEPQGCSHVRVTDKVTGKVKVFFGRFEVVRMHDDGK